jgi:serine protease
MLARNPTLTSGQLLSILAGTSREFQPGSICRQPNFCGSGMLDAGFALASTLPGNANPPPGAAVVIEYYRADLDHYFITADPAEIQYVDTVLGKTFVRTGLYFFAYPDATRAPPGARPVCRFYAGADVQINSHYYTASASECQFVAARWPGIWKLETPAAFYVQVPDAAGTCPDGTLGVYRFFNNRRDANHRYTIDLSVRRAMANRAWVPEGNGAGAVAFCSPI